MDATSPCSSGGHADVAKVLLQNGADVNAVDEDNDTALHLAASWGKLKLSALIGSKWC